MTDADYEELHSEWCATMLDPQPTDIRAPQWQPIETAQGDDRVLVAGWQPSKQNMQGYWWWEEADLADGVPVNYPTATHWAPVLLPPFPPPPQEADK